MNLDGLSFEHDTHFAVGAIGEAGKRVFYIQMGDTETTMTFKCEKQQIFALAEMLGHVLKDFPDCDDSHDMSSPKQPIEPQFAIEQLGIGVNTAANELIVVAELLTTEEDNFEHESVRVSININQAQAAIHTSEILISASRPLCNLCGQPEDEEHQCPRLN